MSTAIGQPINRVDGRAKVTGAGRYSAEIALDNMAYAVLVGAHVPSGRISVINTSEAESAEGVLAVLTHRNLGRIAAQPPLLPSLVGQPAPGETFFPMQDEVVHYAGQPVAIVIAGTLERAQHAATLVHISYEETPSKVRVVTHFIGGGFGCKAMIWPHVTLAALAARHVGCPVKLALSREQMFSSCGHREERQQQVVLGASRDGHLTAFRHHKLSLTSPFDDWAEPSLGVSAQLYACPNYEGIYRLIRANTMTPTFTRGPGESTGMFALECTMDELAYELGLDPLELRLRNYADVDPASGNPWSSKGLKECYQHGAELFGWQRRNPTPRSQRDGNWLIGSGMATVMTQVAADGLGIPLDHVRFEYGDTDLPNTTTAFGSLKVYRRSPLRASQTKSSPLPPPPPPLASRVPSGLHATLTAMPRCPCSEVRSRPLETFHRHTLPSSPQLANWAPSGLHATRRILVGCPRPTHRRVPVGTSHTCTPC